MTPSKCHRRIALSLGATLAAAVALGSGDAQAQEADSGNTVDATGKGIAGGVLLGAEVPLIITAAVGAKTWWPYVLFGAVGAGGGAVGGYFVEQVEPAEPSLYMLAGGMALVIPTVVAVLNATAYDPTEEEEEMEEQDDALPGETLEGEVETTTGDRGGIPMALVGVDAFEDTRVRMGIPAVDVRPRFTPEEVATYGVEQQTEVHFPIVRGAF